jgi:putative nucleotidyltransferase with HDIG domain
MGDGRGPGAIDGGRARMRIMFVDDEQYLLEGLRDGLRSHRREWDMTFLSSAEQALAALAERPYDVVVSDLRMPAMDGVELLELTRDRCPDAVRIVLSGHAEATMMARAAAVAHRLMAKPCDIAELASVIDRSCTLHEKAIRSALDRSAIATSSLPSAPRLYAELTALMNSGTAGAADAARVIQGDTAMAAKVLQLANSAYFGRRSPVSSIAEAVAYLGLEALRALVLQTAAFYQFHPETPVVGFDVERMQRHCAHVARLAAAMSSGQAARDDAFTAGLLHDVGLLVLASRNPTELSQMLAAAADEGVALHEVERTRHGVTHAEIGAHLLGLWGLPLAVTEAIARHHDQTCLQGPFDRVATVYIANALVADLEARERPGGSPPAAHALEHVRESPLGARLEDWRRLAQREVARDAIDQRD